jgi:hypothetical protein
MEADANTDGAASTADQRPVEIEGVASNSEEAPVELEGAASTSEERPVEIEGATHALVERTEAPEDAWTACDRCAKWRRLSSPPKGVFTCANNADVRFNSCDAAQELPDSDIARPLARLRARRVRRRAEDRGARGHRRLEEGEARRQPARGGRRGVERAMEASVHGHQRGG